MFQQSCRYRETHVSTLIVKDLKMFVVLTSFFKSDFCNDRLLDRLANIKYSTDSGSVKIHPCY